MTKEEEDQYLLTLRNLMEELGVPPEELVSNGAPLRLVARVCKEIVAENKSPQAGPSTLKATDDVWSKTRSPLRENSATPGLPEAQGSTHLSRASSQSRNSSPDVEVTVRTSRALSQSSDSSTEAIVERMVPQQPPLPPLPPFPPRVMPQSSWPAPSSLPSRPPPPPTRMAEPIHVDTYRPLSRPSSSTLPIPPVPVPPAPSAPPARQNRRRKRDLDSAAAFPATLNYGDDDGDDEAGSSRPPEPAVAPPPSPPPPPPPLPVEAVQPPAPSEPHDSEHPKPTSPLPLASKPAPSSAVADDLAEARRRLLDSMRRRKTGTPMSATPSLGPTPAPASPKAPAPTSPKAAPAPASPSRVATPDLADYEQEVSGSSAEVPMDIDTEMEDGEIVESDESTSASASAAPVATPAPPVVQPAPTYPSSRASSRGVKRPHAEDLMDGPSRPSSVTRLAPPRRKIFCITTQHRAKLSVPLDGDSDSESEDEEESSSSSQPPVIPVIEIPPDWETFRKNDEQARAIAEKEAHIRRLREKIAALAAKKKSSAQATPSGALTPATADSVVESAIKADLQARSPLSTSDSPPAESSTGEEPAKIAEGLLCNLRLLTTR